MPPLADSASASTSQVLRTGNKRSLTLNLRAPRRRCSTSLVPRCRTSSRTASSPKTATRLGVDVTAIRRRNWRAICASITGFGKTGPYADRAAHDINYEALAGLLSLSSEPKSARAADWGHRCGVSGDVADYRPRSSCASGRERHLSIDTCPFTRAALQWMVFPSARGLVRGADADPRQLPAPARPPGTTCFRRRTASGWHSARSRQSSGPGSASALAEPDLAALHDVPGDERVAGARRSPARSCARRHATSGSLNSRRSTSV